MTAVGVGEACGGRVVVGIEERGVGGGCGVLKEKPVDRGEEPLGVLCGSDELRAQICLEIGHEESGCDALSGDVADDERQVAVSVCEEVVVVAADRAGLYAD